VDDITQAEVQASIEHAEAALSAATARMQPAARGAHQFAEQSATLPIITQPSPPQPAASRPIAAPPEAVAAQRASLQAAASKEQRNNLMWAKAMTQVAGELPVEDGIPPLERRSNKIWADALRSSASYLALNAASLSQPAAAAPTGTDKSSKPR